MNNKLPNQIEAKIAVFKGKEIRKTIHNNEWWFSVANIVDVLTDSVDVRQVQELLGHSDVQTTMIYTHVLVPDAKPVRSPLDLMDC